MNETNFNAKRHSACHTQNLHSTPDKIFPLLCPKREYEWIETWKCDIISSESGFAEPDCIFSTHFPGDIKETWFVDIYEKNERIQFIRFSETRVMRYSISLHDNKDGTTSALWELRIISLNDKGNMYIDNFLDEVYKTRIAALEKMLNHFLATGKMLRMKE
jgi:hypothetical protein